MAYGGRGDDEMSSSLGSSYLDGIPVTISPRFQMPVDLSAVQALLNTPGPSLDAIDQWKYDCNLERQVLEQLRLMDEENERKAREDEEAREEYRERKEREKVEKEEKEREKVKKEEQERAEEERLKREEQEREEEKKRVQEEEQNKDEGEGEEDEEPKEEQTQEQKEVDSSPEGEPVAKPASAPRAPPQPHADNLSGGLQALQLSNGAAKANPTPGPGGAKINFSEFEAESDPFESMELKTINELQELAAVLQKTTTAAPGSEVAPAVSTATAGAGPSSNFQHHQFHQQPYPPPQQTVHYEAHRFANPIQQQQGFFSPRMTQPGYPNQQQHQYLPYPASQQQQRFFPTPRASAAITANEDSGSLKGSKSFGDLMSEIKKEGEAMSRSKEVQLSSRTPPPVPRPTTSSSSSNPTEWVPWPDLDAASPTKNVKGREDDPLNALYKDSEREMCKQIHAMGFPAERVVRTCKALGEDSQKIIHFCLLVDQFVEKDKFPEEEVEHVLHMKKMEEDETRKHLSAFVQLRDLGFARNDIHDALVHTGTSHDKALEHLLR